MESLDDFDPRDLNDLIIELNIYIDNVRADGRLFAKVSTISKLGKLVVDTNKNLFSLIYRFLKLVLVTPIGRHWWKGVSQCHLLVLDLPKVSFASLGKNFYNSLFLEYG